MQRRTFLCAAATAALANGASGFASTAKAWSTAAQLPLRTQELYPAVHRGKLYFAGGIAAKAGVPYFTKVVYSYDPEVDRWTQEADLLENMHHAALVSNKDALYQIGGFNGGYSHIWRMRSNAYRLSDDGWTNAVDLPEPQAEGVLTTAPDQAIHLVSGQSPRGSANRARSDHAETSAHWRWDTGTSRWESLAPIPTPRNSATGGWIGNALVVAGGRTAAGNLHATEIYDHKEDRWRTAAPMPLPQAGTASVVFGSRLIVFGGEIFIPEAGVFADVWAYDSSKDEWTALPDMPTPRHGIGAGVIGDQAFVIGGATQPGGSGTSKLNEVLSLNRI